MCMHHFKVPDVLDQSILMLDTLLPKAWFSQHILEGYTDESSMKTTSWILLVWLIPDIDVHDYSSMWKAFNPSDILHTASYRQDFIYWMSDFPLALSVKNLDYTYPFLGPENNGEPDGDVSVYRRPFHLEQRDGKGQVSC